MFEEEDEGEVEIREPPDASLDDVSGLEETKNTLMESVVVPHREDRYSDFGASGIIVHGPSGMGKTHLAEALVGELGFGYVHTASLDSFSVGRLREIRSVALGNQPCVVFVENLELLASSGIFDDEDETVEDEHIALLNETLDDFDGGDNTVIFVATTTSLSDLHSAVRRSGRIDLKIEVGMPSPERRVKILKDELGKIADSEVSFDGVDWGEYEEASEGLSTADVVEVAERTARSSFSEGGDVSVNPEEILDAVREVRKEREAAVSEVEEEGDGFFEEEDGIGEMVGDDVEPPDVSYDDVGGLERAKRRLQEVVEWPRKHPERLKALDIDVSKGILLHGPPGNGKTLLAKAVANETDRSFISVNGPEVYDCYVGESEANIRHVFERAREEAPSVVFVDEIDSIAGKRDFDHSSAVYAHVVNQLLSEMDGLGQLGDVVMVGATNNAEAMDPAVLRPGRFDETIRVDEPDEEGRREILKVHTEDRKLADDVSLEALVERTEGFSGAEIESVCERAAVFAMRRSVEREEDAPAEITREDFERALSRMGEGGADEYSGRMFG